MIIEKVDLINNTHDVSLDVVMICDHEDGKEYSVYNQRTGTSYVEYEPGPFDYSIHDIEECDFSIDYVPETRIEVENSTAIFNIDESIRIEIDCTIDD